MIAMMKKGGEDSETDQSKQNGTEVDERKAANGNIGGIATDKSEEVSSISSILQVQTITVRQLFTRKNEIQMF